MSTQEKSVGNIRRKRKKRKIKNWPEYTAAISVGAGPWAVGSVIGFTGNMGIILTIETDILSWINSSVHLGAAVACLPFGKLCSMCGRKVPLLCCVFPLIIGWIIILLGQTTNTIIVGRFLTGVGCGGITVGTPLYLSEIAKPNRRGVLGSLYHIFFSMGCMAGYISGCYSYDYTMHVIICSVPSLLFVLLLGPQTDTPVHYMIKGNQEKALESLNRLRKYDAGSDEEFEEIKLYAEHANKSMILIETLLKRNTKRAMAIVFGVMFFKEMSGISSILMVAHTYSKYNMLDPYILTILLGLFQVVFAIISLFLIDKLGRRHLLIYSGCLMAISLLAIAVCHTLKLAYGHEHLYTLSVVRYFAILVYLSAYSLGFGTVSWILPAEVFPPEVKCFLFSIATFIHFIIGFFVIKFYAAITHTIRIDAPYYIATVFTVLSIFHAAFVVVETKNKSLYEIQQLLSSRNRTSL